MAIKIAISLTALSLIQIGMAEVWDRKGSAPNVGQDRQAHYLFIPHHCRITARWVGRGVVARLVWWAVVQYHERAQYKAETFAFSRLYRYIRKPLMPIRYPLAFRGTARPSVCSAWRLNVPKIERLTHPKPNIVSKPDTLPKPYVVPKLGAFPKPFACFCLVCSSRNPRFSWNSERLCISVKPRLAFVISETCKPFSSLSAFSLLGATKAVLRVRETKY
ncbi:hypothetical protein [Prevotella dentalis]|nr:hypothetical protein [Prevotella dentalis]MCF2638140.1 hypothetical protein [Prevotella dentalis]